MDHNARPKAKVNPKESANIVSLCTFFYTWSLFRKGFKKDLEENDIYNITRKLKSKELGDTIEHQWKIENTQHSSPSLYRLLWKCYGKTYLFLGFTQFLMKTAMILLAPQALGKLVSYFTPNQTAVSKHDVYYYAGLVVGLNLINGVYSNNYLLLISEIGIQMKTAISSLIYRKSLKLTPESLSEITIGKIVNVMTKDSPTIEMALFFVNEFWIGLTQIIIIAYVVYMKIGVSAFAGIGFFIAIIPLQLYIGKITASFRIKASKLTDNRLQLTQETLSAIKIIKMYTWERFFGGQISDARKKEMTRIKRIFYAKILALTTGGLVSNLAFYLLIMTYLWINDTITAEIVFFVMSCFQSLRMTVTMSIPLGISQTAECIASLKRIRTVLVAKETTKPKRCLDNARKPLINLKNVTIKLKGVDILENITICIESGLNLLTGPVGAGKSSLLKVILEDFTTKSHGSSVKINGRISYASQEPWLFPSSIKQNILFGQSFDEERYKTVLEVCALNSDIATFENGDDTIVGDRGLNLSKGQQARINLARAVYNDKDIYLLDDCLSALDTHVQKFVFEECIRKFLKNKICVLVSHNISHIKQADNVIILERGVLRSYAKSSEIGDEEIKEIIDDYKDKPDTKIDNIDIIDDVTINEETQLIEGKKSAAETNIYHEVKKIGVVDLVVYKKYVQFGSGPVLLVLIFVIFVITQIATSYTEMLVSNWVNIEQNISSFKLKNLTNTTEFYQSLNDKNHVLTTYTLFIIISTALSFVRAYLHFGSSIRASVNLHKVMITSMMSAIMEFFDTNFIGNVLNRFSKDLSTVDEYVPFIIYECVRLGFFMIGIIILIASVNLSFLIPGAILFCILFVIRKFYMPTGRSLKRLDSATRSPVIGYLNATLEGLSTIRAHECQELLRTEFDRHQDLFTSVNFMLQCSLRSFAFYLDMLCTIFIAVVILKFTFGSTSNVQAGNVGLAITQAFMLTAILQWGIRQWAELENQMTSVERILEYTEIKSESKTGQIFDNWPQEGCIKYENVCLSYNNSTERVLNNINFTIESREKVGIVGRTGAGKSSIISTLFRLYDVDGKITIDGVDTKTLELDCLRSNIAIIPQDPVLFSGTIRTNIDPTVSYTDDEIWTAIETVKLRNLIPSLSYAITESGSNFSSGQRQLICLARAIISKNKIIVLDEATANVDPDTDDLIHRTIQDHFTASTVITIAHRLHSVLNSDRVMVIDKGEIIEFDRPNVLVANKSGVFHKMLEQANLLEKL